MEPTFNFDELCFREEVSQRGCLGVVALDPVEKMGGASLLHHALKALPAVSVEGVQYQVNMASFSASTG